MSLMARIPEKFLDNDSNAHDDVHPVVDRADFLDLHSFPSFLRTGAVKEQHGTIPSCLNHTPK